MGERTLSSDIDPELKGNTLRVYWYMIQQGSSVGVREVQRALGMSSPSVASHHLGKLVDLELVEKNSDNSYNLKRLVKVGVLRNFIGIRGVLLPRYTFVAFFFSMFTLAYIILAGFTPIGIFDRFIAIAIGLVGALFGWFETYRLWKLKLS
ncbi:MAG: hypothetical protein ACFFEF_14375 [Candidatus Thorarchaeota archaeon]